MMKFYETPIVLQEYILIFYTISALLMVINLINQVILKWNLKTIALFVVLIVNDAFLTMLLIDGMYCYNYGYDVDWILMKVISTPLWLIIILLVLYLACGIACSYFLHRFSKRKLSPMSIKESIDHLPVGICIYSNEGKPRLINSMINELCLQTTGRALLNANTFWSLLEEGKVLEGCLVIKDGINPIIRFKNDKTYSFSRYEHNIDGMMCYEIVAVDVTMESELNSKLKEKNYELSQINTSLKKYGENILEYTHEKEKLATKIRIHDDMGKLLLFTKKQLSEPLNENQKNDLLNTWKDTLLEFGKIKDDTEKTFDELKIAAQSLGVEIIFSGINPDYDLVRRIVISAGIECMTNTVAHGEGNKLFIDIQKDDNWIIRLWNNGKNPDGDIKEGTGLSSLRNIVESEGGIMDFLYEPQFTLKIILMGGKL